MATGRYSFPRLYAWNRVKVDNAPTYADAHVLSGFHLIDDDTTTTVKIELVWLGAVQTDGNVTKRKVVNVGTTYTMTVSFMIDGVPFATKTFTEKHSSEYDTGRDDAHLTNVDWDVPDGVIEQGHSSSTHTVAVKFTYTYGDVSFEVTKTVTKIFFEDGTAQDSGSPIEFSVPARKSYAVTYNANGGSGGPTKQTKWHDETLTLTTSKPTRSGYAFVGWATSANATSAAYQSGGSYTANAAITLYAVWSEVPSISSLSVIRCDASGNDDDAGTYCKVTAQWRVDTSKIAGNTGTLTGTITPQNGSAKAITWSSGTTGTSGTAVAIVPNVDTDTQYTVAVSVKDSMATTTRADICTRAKFTIDAYRGGNGLGFGSAAPPNGLEFGWVAQFDQNVTMLKDLTVSGEVKQSSDRRLKEHIAYIGDEAGAFVRSMRPALFEMNGERRLGFYAQDIADADLWGTSTATVGTDGFYALSYAALMAPLVAYVQALEQRIQKLEAML